MYKEPDRHSKRFRNNKIDAISQEFFNNFMKTHPDFAFSTVDIRRILKTFHELCNKIIAETRDGLELPEQLGYIVLGKQRIRDVDEIIDSKLTMKYHKKILHSNWEENQWFCKIYYTNFANKYRFKNSALWGFQASRKLKQNVSKAFKKNPTTYIYLDNYGKVNKIFREAKLRLLSKNKNKED